MQRLRFNITESELADRNDLKNKLAVMFLQPKKDIRELDIETDLRKFFRELEDKIIKNKSVPISLYILLFNNFGENYMQFLY